MSESSKPVKRPTKKAAAKPPPPEEPPKAHLADNCLYEPVWLWRFLFEDGTVWDISAIRDDSTLRELLMKERKITNDRIIGSARVRFVGYADMPLRALTTG